MKRALITGITGQDGAYLAQYLLEIGYSVFGTYRRTSSTDFWRLNQLNLLEEENLTLLENDITDPGSLVRLLSETTPDEVYNLAAQSFVGVSFDQPAATAQITGVGALNILEAIRTVNAEIKFYQASTSELFGKVVSSPQDEDTPFHPRSPYGVAKLYAHWITQMYREAYGIFACCGILFNHESPLRGLEFVTRKITNSLASYKLRKSSILELGNLNALRDWGYAKDYVKGMHLMLQKSDPDCYVLATGVAKSVRDFVSLSCQALEINIVWEGEGLDEIAIDQSNNKTIVKVNPKYFRPAEVDSLIGNASKAKEDLGWRATTSLEKLCELMVEHDLQLDKKE